MPNEQDSYETTKTVAAPLVTSGPYVAVTSLAPNPRASAAFYATVRKDLKLRGQPGEAS
jgi:hypothetical protein